MTRTAPQWPDDIFRELIDLKVHHVAYVPDAGHTRLIQLCGDHDGMTMIPLTTEEEGIGVLAGAWLGGERGVLLVQSSGIGNCINLLALPRVCRFPLLILATMRGQSAELNPWQMPMGQISGEVLRLAGVVVHEVEEPERVGKTVATAGRMAFDGPAAAAVLISQQVVGVKAFGK